MARNGYLHAVQTAHTTVAGFMP